MTDFEEVDMDMVIDGQGDWLDASALNRLSEHPLECIETEFPHYVGSVDTADDPISPSEQHPVFYGCFDWHSAVHSHWCLIRQLRLFDAHPEEGTIRDAVDPRMTPARVEAEVRYLDDHPTFERPYGWGWFLRLMVELHLWEDPQGERWRHVLEPLEEKVIELVESEFLTQERPFRVGTHVNSAFALGCVIDYARVVGRAELAAAATETTSRFYRDDRDYPVEYEPLGWDFLSPSLVEAEVMSRILDGDEFTRWLDGFLPDIRTSPYSSLLEPTVIEPEDAEGLAMHFIGLNLSKAWALATLAEVLDDHEFVDCFKVGARDHASIGLEQAFVEEYAGAHWLSSFALYLLTRQAEGIG